MGLSQSVHHITLVTIKKNQEAIQQNSINVNEMYEDFPKISGNRAERSLRLILKICRLELLPVSC